MSVRAIAFHLPQFHPIPENDEWWGKGFTEWTNVVKEKPRFTGHYQPHLPRELGFYDLRLPEARAKQALLAKQFGIYGFCYYHYWFSGKQLLERPVNEIVKSGEPNFPFCLCWANENWTRRWDGFDNEILMEQRHDLDDDLHHIRSLLPILLDRRYIHVDEKPLLLVYRASGLPEPKKTSEIWRTEAERAGLRGLYLARVERYGEVGDPREIGFDASVEFQPVWHRMTRVVRMRWWHRVRLNTAELGVQRNNLYEYDELVERALADPEPGYPRARCVCPGWDNSPRRAEGASIFVNSTPEKYERWLREIANRVRTRPKDDLPFIFINAWNEWAEGAHLEPCQKWGLRYLEATDRALKGRAAREVEYAYS